MKKRVTIGILIIFIPVLCTCVNKSNIQRKGMISYENKSFSEKEVYEKGYNLPVEREQKEEAETDCSQIMNKIKKIYKECDKGTASNVVISDKTALKMLDILNKGEDPVYYNSNMGMYNYEKMEKFLEQSLHKQKGKIIIYQINSEGGVIRNKFIFDGQDMYLLYTYCGWEQNNTIAIHETFYNRVKEWEYTKKGWFCYELCVPEPPEVTEIVDGNCMVRVKQVKKEYGEIAEKYLLPLGYQGNNLLCSNWNEDNLENLDYSGMYEYLYSVKYQEKLNADKYQNGIPKKEFEHLITEYLPVTAKQLQEYAVYDKIEQTYVWCRLGCMNYAPNAFGGAMPEVTNIKENKDGSVSITIDAVCERLKSDSVMTHILTVYIYGEGKIKYLSNHVLGDGLKKIPAYQYRVKN